MYFPNSSESNFLGKIGMLLSGITILVACGGWAIIIDWRLGLVSIALLPALVVGMMFQVTFDEMMMYIYNTLRETVGLVVTALYIVLLPALLVGRTFEQFFTPATCMFCCVFVFFAMQTIQSSSTFIADQADDV